MKSDFCLGLSEEGFHRIAYTEWGGDNHAVPPVICLHGLTRNGRDFDSLANYLSQQGRHVYCPDIVGRGDSGWLKNPLHYTYEQYVADANVIIARTGAKEIDWIGTSLGGLIGLVLAAQPNSPIRRLVLNDIGPQVPAKGIMRLAKYAGKDPDFTSKEEARQYYKTVLGDTGLLTDDEWLHITESSIRQIAPNKFISKTDHNVKVSPAKSKIAWQAVMHPLKALEGSLFDVDLWQFWRKIRCPVLIIHGKKSDILLPDIIQKMRATHSPTDLIEIPDAGHAPFLMRKEQHELINQWLQQ